MKGYLGQFLNIRYLILVLGEFPDITYQEIRSANQIGQISRYLLLRNSYLIACVSTALIGCCKVLLIAMKPAYCALVFFTCLKFDEAMLIVRKIHASPYF